MTKHTSGAMPPDDGQVGEKPVTWTRLHARSGEVAPPFETWTVPRKGGRLVTTVITSRAAISTVFIPYTDDES